MKKTLLNLFLSKTSYKLKLYYEKLVENSSYVKLELKYRINLVINHLNSNRKNSIETCYSKIKQQKLINEARLKGMADQKKILILQKFLVKANDTAHNVFEILRQNRTLMDTKEAKNSVIDKKNHDIKKTCVLKMTGNLHISLLASFQKLATYNQFTKESDEHKINCQKSILQRYFAIQNTKITTAWSKLVDNAKLNQQTNLISDKLKKKFIEK